MFSAHTCCAQKQSHTTRYAVMCPRRPAVDPNHVMLLGNGSITYYEAGNYFVAECDKHGGGHPSKCKRTRTATASRGGHGPQGRPLGFLCAFLEHCESPDIHDAHSHYEAAKHLSFEQRRAARRMFSTAAGAEHLLCKERPRREGEDSEPEGSVG